MNKAQIVASILADRSKVPLQEQGSAFAPANIALCKYWGKRDSELNLPVTPSLSISLGELGAKTSICVLAEESSDIIFVNGKPADNGSDFALRVKEFLDLFRTTPNLHFGVETQTNIPIGAGLASSASGFSALASALDQLFGWKLPLSTLSIFGRLGSGSAVRSFWHGFVEWQLGTREDGMDSVGVPLEASWPELRVGLLIVDPGKKEISSREAMQRTVLTSPFYSAWPKKQAEDLQRLKKAISENNFWELGEVAEANALTMHALMLSAAPPVLYSAPKTIAAIHKIWRYRQEGLPLFFTQDAGPNIKLLFLEKDSETVREIFPEVKIVLPFKRESNHGS